MSFIPLTAVNRSGIKAGPPWSSRMFVLSKGPRFMGEGSANGVSDKGGNIVERLRRVGADGRKAAAGIMLARGATSGGTAKTRKSYGKYGKKMPTNTIGQLAGKK